MQVHPETKAGAGGLCWAIADRKICEGGVCKNK